MKSLGVLMAIFTSATAAQAQQAFSPNASALPTSITGPNWWPTVLKPYQPSSIKALMMVNSARLLDLIRNGILRRSMVVALALGMDNDYELSVSRSLHRVADADVLLAWSGQAARGSQVL